MNLPPTIGVPFTLIITVPLLLVSYSIVTSFPTLTSLIGEITTNAFSLTIIVAFVDFYSG